MDGKHLGSKDLIGWESIWGMKDLIGQPASLGGRMESFNWTARLHWRPRRRKHSGEERFNWSKYLIGLNI